MLLSVVSSRFILSNNNTQYCLFVWIICQVKYNLIERRKKYKYLKTLLAHSCQLLANLDPVVEPGFVPDFVQTLLHSETAKFDPFPPRTCTVGVRHLVIIVQTCGPHSHYCGWARTRFTHTNLTERGACQCLCARESPGKVLKKKTSDHQSPHIDSFRSALHAAV